MEKVENEASWTQTSPTSRQYDLVIIGAGIVGLATAREILLREPRLKVAVLEKDNTIANQQSGHNSGVIHTGIYYTPGSLKAKACVRGHKAIIDYAQAKGIAYNLCGKVIVALDESELGRLNELYQRGVSNGVQDLEIIGPERLRELEPYAAGIKAIHSPNTGIIDYVKVAKSFAADIQELGGEIITNCQVMSLDQRDKQTILGISSPGSNIAKHTEIRARFVISCGGLQSDFLSKMGGVTETDAKNQANGKDRVKIVPFRGDYYVLRPAKRAMVKSLIYPVPDPQFPFLGVHFTLRMDGEVWAGPNAVLAFAREGYSRWKINPPELWQTLSFNGFWKLASKYWKTGLAEMYRDYYKAAFAKELQRYMPALQAADLVAGPSGVRAQALAADGQLVDDFLIGHGENIIHVRNAPSPAATSSMVIAEMIVDEAQRSFDLVVSAKK